MTESNLRADIMTAYANLSGEFNPTVPTRVISGQGKTTVVDSNR